MGKVKLSKYIALIISFCIFALWLGWVLQHYVLGYVGLTWSHEQLGQWGDTFGALNALFAGVASIAVIMTLTLQQRQINRSQRERYKQNFEGTFFQLLRLLRELRAEVSYFTTTDTNNSRRVGGRALKGAYDDIKWHLISENPDARGLTKLEIAKIYTQHIDNRSEDNFDPYFRIIYTILKLIDKDKNLNEREKVQYGNLMASQLGSPEVALIVLSGLTDGAKDFSFYITRFRIPRYLPDSVVLRAVAPHYDAIAFEELED